jgi:hypothetical protein
VTSVAALPICSIYDGGRLDLGGSLGRPLVRGERLLADHVVTERGGLDGLDSRAWSEARAIKIFP